MEINGTETKKTKKNSKKKSPLRVEFVNFECIQSSKNEVYK